MFTRQFGAVADAGVVNFTLIPVKGNPPVNDRLAWTRQHRRMRAWLSLEAATER